MVESIGASEVNRCLCDAIMQCYAEVTKAELQGDEGNFIAAE